KGPPQGVQIQVGEGPGTLAAAQCHDEPVDPPDRRRDGGDLLRVRPVRPVRRDPRRGVERPAAYDVDGRALVPQAKRGGQADAGRSPDDECSTHDSAPNFEPLRLVSKYVSMTA